MSIGDNVNTVGVNLEPLVQNRVEGGGAPPLVVGPRSPSPVLLPVNFPMPMVETSSQTVDLRDVQARIEEVPLLVSLQQQERLLLGEVPSRRQAAVEEAGRILRQLALSPSLQGPELEFCVQRLFVAALRSPELAVLQVAVNAVVDVLTNPLANRAAVAIIRPVLDCEGLLGRVAPFLAEGFKGAEGILSCCIVGDLARLGNPLAIDRLAAHLAGGGRLAVGAYVGLLQSPERRAWEIVYFEGRRGSVLAIEALLRFKNKEIHRPALLEVDVSNLQSLLIMTNSDQSRLATKILSDLAELGHRRAREIVVSASPASRTPPGRGRWLNRRQPTYGPNEWAVMLTGSLDGFGRLAFERELSARKLEDRAPVPPFEPIRTKALSIIHGPERNAYLAAVPAPLRSALIRVGMDPAAQRAVEDDLITLQVLDKQLRLTGTTVLDLIWRAVEANRAQPIDGTLHEANLRAFLPVVLDSYDNWIRLHRDPGSKILMSAEVVGAALMDRDWFQPLPPAAH